MAVANQKGGVGKTTVAVHLAHGLALAGQRTVLFDFDPQGNATLAVEQMEAAEPPPGPEGLLRTASENFYVLPSPGARRHVDRHTELDVAGLSKLVDALATDGVDWLIVDCPPRMDQWGWAGLELCSEVLVPVQAEFFSMHGLTQMMETLEEAAKRFPGRGQLLGVVASLVDLREPIEGEVLESLTKHLGEKLLRAILYRDSQLVEAASHGLSLFDYNPRSKGARSFGELVREVCHGRP